MPVYVSHVIRDGKGNSVHPWTFSLSLPLYLCMSVHVSHVIRDGEANNVHLWTFSLALNMNPFTHSFLRVIYSRNRIHYSRCMRQCGHSLKDLEEPTTGICWFHVQHCPLLGKENSYAVNGLLITWEQIGNSWTDDSKWTSKEETKWIITKYYNIQFIHIAG